MSKQSEGTSAMPARVESIQRAGAATWAAGSAPTRFAGKFDDARIPVANVRHLRIWGLQVDDERELPGRERTNIPDEDLWQVTLVAKDGSRYELNSDLLVAAAD